MQLRLSTLAVAMSAVVMAGQLDDARAQVPQAQTQSPAGATVASADEIKVPAPPPGLFEGLSKDLTPPPLPATAPQTPLQPAPAAATSTPATPPVAPVVESPAPAPVQQAAPATAPVATPAPAPAFALLDELKDRIGRDRQGMVPKDDRDDVLKFYQSRQGAPLWVDASGLVARARTLRTEFDKAGDFALDAKAFETDDVKATTPQALADAEYALTAAALRYARHARGGRTDPAQLSKAIDRKPQLIASADVLAALGSGNDLAATLRGFHPKHPQFEKLRQQLLRHRQGEDVVEAPPAPAAIPGKKASAPPKPPSRASIERKIVTNMEMWRWMPEMGAYHIQANIPEYQFRMVRDGKVVHTERIIVGKPVTMTPMFSDEMRLVVFKPFWNVPESIKWKELQPQLMRSGSALAKAGLKAQINGRDVDPGQVEWETADMRQVHIFQPPGPANALGQVKFLFPNKHDVYMHDTPTKPLFSTNVRTYSHGCVRVRDPLKFAEVILSEDKGWSRTQINQLANTGPDNNEVKLNRKIPVHLTYFTAWVDDGDKLQTVSDIYGHENRVQLGIEGKAHLIVQPAEEKYTPPSREERQRIVQIRRQREAQQDPVGAVFKSLFGF